MYTITLSAAVKDVIWFYSDLYNTRNTCIYFELLLADIYGPNAARKDPKFNGPGEIKNVPRPPRAFLKIGYFY